MRPDVALHAKDAMSTRLSNHILDKRAQAISRSESSLLQRKCGCGQRTIAGAECKSCKKEEEDGELQRAATNTESINEVPPVVHDALRSPGRPLDAQTRAFMEPRFSHDFSRVRVHTDAKAAESARAVNALAFTVGQNIVFGAHQYAPSSAQGRRLLAHELTHTLQQAGSAHSMMPSLRIGPADDAHEREADAQAARVVGTGVVNTAQAPAFSAAQSLQRQKGGTDKPAKAQPTSCMKEAAESKFSRGNDDLRECQYETALIRVKLLYDPCACTKTQTSMPLRLDYNVLMGGKNFQDPGKTKPETQASEIASGLTPEGKPAVGPGGRVRSGISLQETGGTPTGPLIHKIGGGPGDPGDTLTQSVPLQATIACAGGSASGEVKVGGNQTINWKLTTGKKVEASISLTEEPVNDPNREPTPTFDVTKKGSKGYPAFPGTPRDKDNCQCHPVTGQHMNKPGKTCPPKYTTGAAKVGR
jgi:hypothetical protein